MPNKPRIGIIGSGRLGTAIARQSLQADYEVHIANAHGPNSLTLILRVLLPKAIAATVEDVIANSDIIILAIPMNQYRTVPAKLLKGKIVIDAMNYWAPTEGDIPEFTQADVSTSEIVQQYLSDAYVVKTLNQVAYNELNEHALKTGHQNRRAIALVGNSRQSKHIVSEYIDALGFDTVDFGDLKYAIKLQPDTPLFNKRLTIDQLNNLVTRD